MYTRKTPIPYIRVIMIRCQSLSKKVTTRKINVNNLSVRSLQGSLLLFIGKSYDFVNKNEEFYNPSIKKVVHELEGRVRVPQTSKWLKTVMKTQPRMDLHLVFC